MTVSTISSIAEFVTNGVTTNYPFYFKFIANEDLVVTYVDPAGASSTLTLGTHYTVNGAGNDQGGSIVTTTALAGPGQLVVSREMTAYQQTSLRNQGKFLAETHEDVFDRLTMLIQQGFAIFTRALTRPFGRDYFFAENRRITSVSDPVAQQDAATKNYTQTYVGGVISAITGPINNAANVFYLSPKGTPAVVQDLSSKIDPLKGGDLVGVSPMQDNGLGKTLRQRFEDAHEVDFAVEYLTAAELAIIQAPYPIGQFESKPTIDITAKLLAAIADLGGTHDPDTAYLYSPVKVLKLPAGSMGLNLTGTQRILIGKNNINIIGAGTFNTRLCHIGTGIANEMFRFKEAYACGLAHLTLDGGLPFTPVGTETYGCEIPLVLDLTPHFYSEGLNVVNYRHRGIQGAHVWESFLGNDLRIFNGGWFPVSGSAPGGLMFDNFRQESGKFPGSENNQTFIGKYSFTGNGSPYSYISPSFNLTIHQVVCECRTYGSYIPPGIGNSKVVVSGLSAAITVNHAYYYFHDQAASIGAGAVLFDFQNAGIGCRFLNQVVYQEIPSGSSGRTLEVSKIFKNSSAFMVEVDLKLQDVNCTTALFDSATSSSLIKGAIHYRRSTTRALSDLMGAAGQTYFIGPVTYSTGAFGSKIPYYDCKAYGVALSNIDGVGAFEEYPARAHGSYRNTALAPGSKNLTCTNPSAGTYVFTFINPMPDAQYTLMHNCQKGVSASDDTDIASQSATGFTIIVRDSAGTFHNSGIVNVLVYR